MRALRLRLEPVRGHHRREREAHKQRHHHRKRHRQAETLHEAADHAAHEADRREDGDERQGGGHHGEANLVRRFDRRLHRRHALFFDEAEDVLQHHDRVVDDDADRERERQHGQHVEREAHVPDQREGGDDRGRNRDGGDHRRAEIAEEQPHHDGGENGADHQVFLHARDRRFDELRLVADDAKLITGGQDSLQIGEPLLDVVGDLDGVGAGLLADLQQHGGLAVDARLRARFGHAVLDASDIAQPNRVARHFAQHHVAEGVDRLEAAARAQRDRLRALIHAAAGNIGVLRLQRAGHVVDRQFLRAQQRGVEPHVHLTAATANHHDLADAVGAFEPAPQDLVRKLGDVADRFVGGHGDGDHRSR